jgi:3'(2'), 5'-bisphosphate nucleotidase
MSHDIDYAALLDGVEKIAERAGQAVNEIYERADADVRYKDDKSPLTAADLASHKEIKAGLDELAPEIPTLSEEGKAMGYEERRSWHRFWLVDPLDGTKEFIKRNGEFTVNVALVEDGVPVLGVVHASTLGRTYGATRDGGAWRRDGDGERRPIRASGTGGEGLVVVASRSHAGPELTAFLEAMPEHSLRSMGSSLKLCLVAEGAADVYPRIGPTMEWDTGAAHAVVLGAGGEVLDLEGKPLMYNKENLLNPYFIVLGERPVPWREALAASK